ncbi:hypothetical protein GCM10018980_12780 [Streptomyces capoamus]|uniref:Uncharacterized protein n=1 Tax=Streptomyces capoamus TaxID=68183 RepID=A0A919EVH1_9ACTN|nr:hypothetical protein GCM10018980_12780 [Streptomyces capoamus]
MLETRFAADHQRMLRYRRERHGERVPGTGVVDAGRGEAEGTAGYSTTRWWDRPADPFGPAALQAGPPGQGADHGGGRVAVTDATASARPGG